MVASCGPDQEPAFEQVSEGAFVSVLERSRLISRLPGMAWCSPTDTVGALARRISAVNGREMSAAGRGTVGAYMEHVSVMQVCLICIAGFTGPTGSVHKHDLAADSL